MWTFTKALVVGLSLTVAGCFPAISGDDAATAHAMCRQFDAKLIEASRDGQWLSAVCDGNLKIKLKIK